ncbi:DUF7146 domain-containing protein [Paragemmobacter straminiformis]|uniref:Toprim domain-containing protein n=1 Tax=Paragemmobacter straminiformis TaxID=2045119 RepID=A0A842I9Y5_9RHOB|nr:toprim domain-containing protein [Gemmobacter straminiformis]MBC2836426.1 toprim domain-containing protein [Gemmobacter straminiformis]
MTDARTIVLALGGKWHGRYGLCRCPAHGDRKPSLSLSDGSNGRLLAKCHTGCDFAAIVEALRGLGLIEGGGAFVAPDPIALAQREAAERAEAAKRAAQAERLWQEAQPIEGTAAEAYLRGRGIGGALPPSLRFHPACWHQSAKRFPAMVARLEGAIGFAVHRTYLRADGSGKAGVAPAKAMLGATSGGAVRLSQGQGALAVAEGLETALSLSYGLLSAPTAIWAALSTSGLATLRLPPAPSRLTIASDGDKPGREAAHALAERAVALGWAVSILPAPDGADWNDVLTGKAVLA